MDLFPFFLLFVSKNAARNRKSSQSFAHIVQIEMRSLFGFFEALLSAVKLRLERSQSLLQILD